MRRLSATDAAFLYTESVSGPMHISSICVVEGEVSFDTLLAHFDACMEKLPSYRQKIAQTPLNIAHPVWVDDPDFAIGNHVIHAPIPEGSTLEDGFDEAVRLNERMLDRDKPLWAVYAITGVPDRTLLLQATHHAMIDGASGIEVLATIFTFDPNYELPVRRENRWEPEPPPSTAELFTQAMTENMERLSSVRLNNLLPSGEQTGRLLQRAARIGASFVSKPAITAPFNAGLVGPDRRLRWFKVPFAEIREIRRALGGTINDVVLTVVSEGIARYLGDRSEPVDDQYLRIMCPVNVRTEDKKGALGNQVSAIFPMLPAWSLDPTQRLSAVIAEMARIKGNEEAQALTLVQESVPEPWPIALWPTQLVGTALDPTALAARIPQPTLPSQIRPPNFGINFVCTNVPGMQVPQYICGHQVLDQVGVLVLTGNLGLGITILSYNKTLYISFISEPRLLPDVEVMVDHCHNSFDDLLGAARERAAQFGT
ncbi:MAG: wax ester/triacylglycerol synthase domain-containing protein [Pseudomonadota bacterium]